MARELRNKSPMSVFFRKVRCTRRVPKKPETTTENLPLLPGTHTGLSSLTRFFKLLLLISAVLLIQFTPKNSFPAVSRSEKDSFKEITALNGTEKNEELISLSKQFLKNFPKSDHVADVRFLMADNETDPNKAIYQFRVLVNKYSYFNKRDSAQYKICEIYYLQSKWNELRAEARRGIELFRDSSYRTGFKFFLAKSLIHLEKFDEAKKVCIDITRTNHDYNNLSNSLLLLSYINRNMYGLSRSYLYSLSEIISGFKNSDNMPAALYLLGRYYRSKDEYNKAFSAYSDVVEKFPNSPEAEFSRRELSLMAQYNPSRTAYIPDREAIKKSDNIDIQPEIEIEDDKKILKENIQYSISIGPFENIQNARDIKKLIDKDLRHVEIAEVRKGFFIYAGRFAGLDPAVKMRTRLAEELGINGNIVKIIKDADKIYIYEE